MAICDLLGTSQHRFAGNADVTPSSTTGVALMSSQQECLRDDLAETLRELRDGWKNGGSTSPVPPELSRLLDNTVSCSSSDPSKSRPAWKTGQILQTATLNGSSQAPPVPPSEDSNGDGTRHATTAEEAAAALTQLSTLNNVARVAMLGDSNASGVGGATHVSAARARSRARALDGVRIGLLFLLPYPDSVSEEGKLEAEAVREAVSLAAIGARDERWEARVAAARLAGECLLKGSPPGEGLPDMLSSKEGCWLPALLVDGYSEVEEAAYGALTPSLRRRKESDHHEGSSDARLSDTPLPTAEEHALPSSLSPPWAPTEAASAVMRGACDVLRALTESLYQESGHDGSTDSDRRVVDLSEEENTRTALRALRGGVRLLEPAISSISPACERKKGVACSAPLPAGMDTTALRVSALQAVEAWLAVTLKNPPTLSSLPWEDEQGTRGASPGGDVAGPGGALSVEACRAVRELLASTSGIMRANAARAAEVAVEEFRHECCRAVPHGRGMQDAMDAEERQGEEKEDFWQQVYCGLLVRLETLLGSTAEQTGSVDSGPLQLCHNTASSEDEPVPLELPRPANSPAGDALPSQLVAEIPSHYERVKGAAAIDNGHRLYVDTVFSLAGQIAEALAEVPFAHDRAVPPFLDDDTRSVKEIKAVRARGHRRQRWLISSAQLLLRAAKRLCRLCDGFAMKGLEAVGDSRESNDGTNDGATAVAGAATINPVAAMKLKLLVASLAFEQPSTTADDPTEAWLSCVGSAASNPGLASITTASLAADKEDLITSPMGWESCVSRRGLAKHEIRAPWASNPLTCQLATQVVHTAWEALRLSGGSEGSGSWSPVGEKNAAALMQELRGIARRRGWRAEAGVGVKHAISAAIRRLRFPRMSGAALGHALPLILALADDHDAAHQAVGYSLLFQIETEAASAELAWQRGLLLEVLERGIRVGGVRDASAALLCLTAVLKLLQRAPQEETSVRSSGGNSTSSSSSSSSGNSNNSIGRAGVRIAREALAQAGRTSDGEFRVVMVVGAAALLELPATGGGYGPCQMLRPALLCLLPILQSHPASARLDARAATLRALNALCLSCWPRIHAHASKLLCALLWTCGDCSRRAKERDASEADAAPLGVDAIGSSYAGGTITAAMDENVLKHATRVGALVLLLGGESARALLADICEAVEALRPAGVVMGEIADTALRSGRRRKFADGTGERKEYD